MKLKPVTLVNTTYSKYSQNTTQQLFLLNALKITRDPKKLREMIGVKSVADVFRTLDKLALRKEYHKSLTKLGIDFDFIARGIKVLAENGFKDSDRLKAYQILLKSLGMDTYDEKESGGNGWEDALQKIVSQESKKEIEGPIDHSEDYEVSFPEVPDAIKARKKQEEDEVKEGNSLYG